MLQNPGTEIATIPRATNDEAMPALETVIALANQHGYTFTYKATIIPARLTNVLQFIDESVGQRVAIESKDNQWSICHWDDWYDFPKFNYKEKIYVTPRDNVQLFLASSKKDTLFESYIGADVVAKEKGITRLLVYIHYVDSQGKTYKVNAEKIGK